jgi:hypothetical protein
MYYQGSGSSVNCCQRDGCNRGLGQNFRPWSNENPNEQRLQVQFPGASHSSELEAAMVETLRTSTALPGAPLTSFFESLSPLQKQLLIQQQFQQIPSTATKDLSSSHSNQRLPVNNGLNFQHSSAWLLNTRQTGIGTGTQQFENNNSLQDIRKNGNCVKYFEKVREGEWLPNILIPLTYDRASKMRVAVFYAKFNNPLASKTGLDGDDHVVARLIGDNKSNTTMYTFKLFHVGQATISVSR